MNGILVPLDGSIHALKALTIACDLAHKYHSSVILVNIINEEQGLDSLLNSPLAHLLDEQVLKMAMTANASGNISILLRETIGEQVLQAAVRKMKNHDVDIIVAPLMHGNPIAAILRAAKVHNANTIVMGCRGHSEDSFGSVAYGVFARFEGTAISVK